jgi:hypothetical protein
MPSGEPEFFLLAMDIYLSKMQWRILTLDGPNKNWLFKEWVYLHEYKCVIIQFISVFITLQVFARFLEIFSSIVPSLLVRNYFVVFEICQTIFTRSVHSSSLEFSHYVSHFMSFWLRCMSWKQELYPSQIVSEEGRISLSGLTSGGTYFCKLCY